MVLCNNLSVAFAALATAISLSVCCPTGQCIDLPNLSTYFTTAITQHSVLQTRVNISTTKRMDLGFHPQFFEDESQNKNNILPVASNDCDSIFNVTSGSVGVDTPCPWTYQCDYDPQRIPAVIFRAKCDSEIPRPGVEWNSVCDEVFYPISYIKTESCDPLESNTEWNLVTSVLPISCNVKRILF